MDPLTEKRAQVLVDTSRDPGVSWLELAVPEKANCLSVDMMSALEEGLRAVTGVNPVIAIRAQGEIFSAGFDVRDTTPLTPRFLKLESLLETIRDAGGLTVAIVRGKAIGAGADLATHCDLRIALPGSTLRFPGFQKFGVVLGSRRLCQLVGVFEAVEAMSDGKIFDHEAALALGLANVDAATEADAESYVVSLGARLADHDHHSIIQMVRALRGEVANDSAMSRLAHSLVAAKIQ